MKLKQFPLGDKGDIMSRFKIIYDFLTIRTKARILKKRRVKFPVSRDSFLIRICIGYHKNNSNMVIWRRRSDIASA